MHGEHNINKQSTIGDENDLYYLLREWNTRMER